jgi:hypothetical protein
MVALQAWLARLAWFWKSRFHYHGGLLYTSRQPRQRACAIERASVEHERLNNPGRSLPIRMR